MRSAHPVREWPSYFFERERDTLAAADAKRHDATTQAVALHRPCKPRRQDRARRADRMAMCDRAAFDIDDLFIELRLASNRDRGEGFVDLDPFDVLDGPAGQIYPGLSFLNSNRVCRARSTTSEGISGP